MPYSVSDQVPPAMRGALHVAVSATPLAVGREPGSPAARSVGRRLLDRDAAAARLRLEGDGPARAGQAADETLEQRSVHLAHDLGVALGDCVEWAVAQPQDAVVVVEGS